MPRTEISAEEKSLVRRHLSEILASPAFRSSKRSQEFLDYVVQKWLDGDFEALHERSIGAALFGRPIDYETSTDAIVRVKANEVRKRLAQYYLDAPSGGAVRIELPPGSYLPQVHLGAQFTSRAEPAGDGGSQESNVSSLTERATSGTEAKPQQETRGSGLQLGWARRTVVWVGPLLIGILALAFLIIHRPGLPKNDLAMFWAPVFRSDRPVVLSVGRIEVFWLSPRIRRALQNQPVTISVEPGDILPYGERNLSAGSLMATLLLTQFFERQGKQTQFRWASGLPDDDRRSQHVIHIGAFNNPWTLGLYPESRFQFRMTERDGVTYRRIEDRKIPTRVWELKDIWPKPMTRDYALITRLLDTAGDRVQVFAAGITQYGTQAAGEFLIDSSAWKQLAATAPSGWEGRNLQVVLEAAIIDNKVMRPQILAAHFW